MVFELQNKTFRWLKDIRVLTTVDVQQTSKNTSIVNETVQIQFQIGLRVGMIIIEIYKKKGIPIPTLLNHLKSSNHTAAKLYNWNSINEALKKFDFEIDSQTKNCILNGQNAYLNMILRRLYDIFNSVDSIEDSLDTLKQPTREKQPQIKQSGNQIKQSLALSVSVQPPKKLQKQQSNGDDDLLEFIINKLINCLKLTRKQAVGLLSENNKYLAHVLVKGVKGQFADIEEMMKSIFQEISMIVQKMIRQNDMCFFFLQVIKPSLLSKSQEVAEWGCRILSKVGFQLANQQMLPLAYDWFVRDAGGLSTTILALNRHPNLNQQVVTYILQFARYNVTELFTIQLRKITNNDNLAYIKFVLLIFQSLIESKTSAQDLLNSGAIDYWIETCISGAEADEKNSLQLRLLCIQFVVKIWKAYPSHIQQSTDQVNAIMRTIKMGIRQSSQIMKFSLIEALFSLLDHFALEKNPYASIVYKKLTFLFIQHHEEATIRQFMLRNLQNIFQKYQSIPVDIFLQPFIKQVKISDNKSYMLNIFDFEFIAVAVQHKKLKTTIALQLYDLLAKTKLNSYPFTNFANHSMQILIDRFLDQEIFIEYTLKLIKISLAMFYSTLKAKKNFDEHQRMNAQKRAEIVNFIISFVERGNTNLNQEIKQLVIHVKIQIYHKLKIQHKGIQKILSLFTNVQDDIAQAMENINEIESNAPSNKSSNNGLSSKSKNDFYLPKIQRRGQQDETVSQQSLKSSSSKMTKQEFPSKNYTGFASEDEDKFLKDNGLGIKKKVMSKSKRIASYERQVDPKLQDQILKIKEKREEVQQQKEKQNQQIHRKKELLKMHIKKELEQRNLQLGYKGNSKDYQVQVIFRFNEVQEHLLEDQQHFQKVLLTVQDEDRNMESIKLVSKKYYPFLKKLFNKYCTAKMAKKDYFQEQNESMSQIDLLRICKQKDLQKNKQTIINLLKIANDKQINSFQLNAFIRFIQLLSIYLAHKEKFTTHLPLGEFMKLLLMKMEYGQNIKLEEDQDHIAKNLNEKLRNNPQIQIPENYKKISERTIYLHQGLTYPVLKSNKNNYFVCFEILNEIFHQKFKCYLIEEEVRFREESKIVLYKKNIIPRPLKKEQTSVIEQPIEPNPKINTKPRSLSKNRNSNSNSNLNSTQKQNLKQEKKLIINSIERKKQEQEQQRRRKKQQEDEQFKIRQAQVKKKLQQQQNERQSQKERKKEQKKQLQRKQIENKRKEKELQEKYRKQQKQKLQKYKKEQQETQKEENQRIQREKKKEDEQKKQKYKTLTKKEEEKRKEEYQRMKKQRQQEQIKEKMKKQEEQRKKQAVKKQAMKKLQNEKEKYQTTKIQKEILKKIYQQPQITQVFGQFKEQLKGLFTFGTEYNDYKIEQTNQNYIGQKGWLTICQQMSICDVPTANFMFKQNSREGNNGFTVQSFEETLLALAVKKQMQTDLQNYESLKGKCIKILGSYLNGLKIPKQKQRIKQFFIGLKNQRKKQEIALTGPNGQKEKWQVND